MDILGRQELLNPEIKINVKDSLFFRVLWGNLNLDYPVINTYTDLKNSGRTGLITNENIRIHFTSLEQQIRKLSEMIDARLKLQAINIDKEIINSTNLVRLVNAITMNNSFNNGDLIDYEALLRNQKILNIIAAKFDLADSVLRDRNLLLTEIQELIRLIETELSE